MGFWSKVLDKFSSPEEELGEEGYVELDTEAAGSSSKIMVRPFILQEFEGIREILDSLRDGKTIALINMKPLKEKDIIELKRAINKIKKTTDAIDGEIAGFGEDYIVVTPAAASIFRTKKPAPQQEQQSMVQDDLLD